MNAKGKQRKAEKENLIFTINKVTLRKATAKE